MTDVPAHQPSDDVPETEPRRCPACDSVITGESSVCLMCGALLEEPARQEQGETADVGPSTVAPTDETGAQTVASSEAADIAKPLPEVEPKETTREAAAEPVIQSVLEERQSRIVFWMAGVVFVFTAVLGTLIVRHGGPVQLALVPTATSIPPTPTFTPSATLPPTETSPPTSTPTVTPQPTSTPTPQPPRAHTVSEGETLFGLSLLYNVSMDAIAALNGFTVETPLQANQSIQVPWPTATPPLEPIVFEINGEPVIADPTDCERYEIQEGDAISVIAARRNVDFELLLAVNRLTDRTILQPGDTICIPKIIHGEVLPPTPGPSPTPSPTSFPAGPELLYPINGTTVEMEQEPIVLQWVAVKDLAPDEWYMLELVDLEAVGEHPKRGFTRENAYRIPADWRPEVPEYRDFRWRISIVRVTGQREDGGFIFTFGGRNSRDALFSWRGAIPTPTLTPTATPSPEP